MDDSRIFRLFDDLATFCTTQVDTNCKVMEEFKLQRGHMKTMLETIIKLRQIIANQEARLCVLERGESIPVTVIPPKKGGSQLH